MPRIVARGLHVGSSAGLSNESTHLHLGCRFTTVHRCPALIGVLGCLRLALLLAAAGDIRGRQGRRSHRSRSRRAEEEITWARCVQAATRRRRVGRSPRPRPRRSPMTRPHGARTCACGPRGWAQMRARHAGYRSEMNTQARRISISLSFSIAGDSPFQQTAPCMGGIRCRMKKLVRGRRGRLVSGTPCTGGR